jgi:hypothetical protein
MHKLLSWKIKMVEKFNMADIIQKNKPESQKVNLIWKTTTWKKKKINKQKRATQKKIKIKWSHTLDRD